MYYYLFNSWPSGHLSPLSFGFPDSIRVVSATARQPPGKQEPPRGIARSREAPPLSVPSAAGRPPGAEVMRERTSSALGAGAWWGQHTIQTYLCVRWAAFRQGGGFTVYFYWRVSFCCFYKWTFWIHGVLVSDNLSVLYLSPKIFSMDQVAGQGCFWEDIRQTAVSKHNLACVLSEVARWELDL